MSPRHFSNQMFSPYFQSSHYKNESPELRIQKSIEKKLLWIARIPIVVFMSIFRFPPRNK